MSLPPAPASPSNRAADDPRAAQLGHRLFFDPGLSANGEISCATCHIPSLAFTDAKVNSVGLGRTNRNAPTLVGAVYSPWLFWDGRRDSLWAQALAPMEAPPEMGSSRLAVVRHVLSDPRSAALYEAVFERRPRLGPRARGVSQASPFGSAEQQDAWYRLSENDRRQIDAAYANVGKAIAAYERKLLPAPSRFDHYVEALVSGEGDPDEHLSPLEVEGLRLFVDSGRTLCLRCHNGPMLTNQSFHDVGTRGGEGDLADFGRFLGVQAVLVDPFNCLGRYSDARPEACAELRFLDKSHVPGEIGKFKTPTLRGLALSAPYMHHGLEGREPAVVEHYRRPAGGGPEMEGLEVTPLEITDDEARALVAFLASFDRGAGVDARWLNPPE